MRMNSKKRIRILCRVLFFLILMLIIIVVGFYIYSRLKQEYTIVYDSHVATTGSISNALSFTGNLDLVDSAVYTAPANTKVRTIYVSLGEDVQEGAKLVRMMNGETIQADFNARVNTLNIEEGDEVNNGDELIEIANFSRMQVTLSVDEYYIADVAVGQVCTVAVDAMGKTFETKIDSIDYISTSIGNVAYYSAVCYVDVDEGIYPGMQVSVTIPQEEATDVVILKTDALSFDQRNNAFVWMYDENQTLVQVPVETGVSNGNYIEIKSGLADGDVVYVESEETTASPMTKFLSGFFGNQQMNGQMGSRNNRSGRMRNSGGGNTRTANSSGGGNSRSDNSRQTGGNRR